MAENDRIPRLRFKGYIDDWELNKYSEIGTNLQGGNLSYNDLDCDGTYSVILYGDLYTTYDCRIFEIEKRSNKKGLTVIRNDILFPQSTTVDAVSLISPACMNDETAEASGVFVIRPYKDVDGNFICYYSKGKPDQRLRLARKGQGLTITHLYYESIKDEDIMLPCIKEQEDIVALFNKLSDLISLHLRKYEKLVEIKKSLLENMFPTEGESVPKIRFREFSDDWERRRLGELVERVVRKNTNNESDLPLTISAQDGLVDQISYFNNRVASKDVSGYYLLYNGEFAYNKSTSDGSPYGAVKRLDRYQSGVLSVLYIAFSIRKDADIDSDFLSVYFDTDRWHKGVSERAAEGARNHGLLNISADDFFDITVTVPRSEDEQRKIAAAIKSVDSLIALQKQTVDKLKDMKSALLEKMFV